jgi:tetratricopeptide (TPR) repeat protein
LEDRSLLAFQEKLPDSWIFRRETPDYGIDGSVEIFDDKHSTGNRFYVQLKATSKEEKRKARLKRESVEYYRELDLPVLMVLYVDPEDILLARWMHQFDPYYGGWGKKWVTLTFTEEDIWRSLTHESIADTVEKISKLQKGTVSFPMQWGVFFRDDKIGGTTSSRIYACLSRERSKVESLLRFTTLGERHFGKLEIDEEEAVASIADRYYCTLHLRGKEIGSPEQFAASLLVLTGLTLAQASSHGAAAKIFSQFAPKSSIAVDPNLWDRIARSMIRADRIPKLLELSERLHDKEDAPGVIPTTSAQILSIPSLSTDAAAAYEEFLKRRVSQAKEEGLSPASAHYNYGNFLRSKNCNLEAFKQYRRAAEEDPKYWKKNYFCGEMAGVLFDEGRYRPSAKLYERALRLEESERWRPLYGDALAHSGRYKEAYHQFQTHIDRADEIKPYWCLKAEVLRGIIEDLGIVQQRRDRSAAHEASNRTDTDVLKKNPREMNAALQEDALCTAAWFDRGVLYHEKEESEEAFFSFVAAGVAENDSLEAWTNALSVALGGDIDIRLLGVVAQASYNRYGELFVTEMNKRMEGGSQNSPAYQHLQTLLFDLLRDAEPEESREVRFWASDGSHDTITIGETRDVED